MLKQGQHFFEMEIRDFFFSTAVKILLKPHLLSMIFFFLVKCGFYIILLIQLIINILFASQP